MEQLPEAASVGNRAPTDGGGVSGGVLLPSASDDDGGRIQKERDARAAFIKGPACITNTRHSMGLGRGHALGRGSQDSTVDP